MNGFLDKLEDVERRFLDIERQLSDPSVTQDLKRYEALNRDYSQLKPGINDYRKLKTALDQKAQAQTMLNDPELSDMAQDEIDGLIPEIKALEVALNMFLLPKNPDDQKNAVLEIRGGTGGDEAALFANDLYRMYQRYAEKNAWTWSVVDHNITELGGTKEAVVMVSGDGVFQALKFESGVHRVQRVPNTEASGRIHTSAVSVAVLPEADDVDVTLNPKDLRVDTYRASGAGGQHVNKTDSAVRITHIPTGTAVACQDERSQFQNKEKALRLLKSRLYDFYQQQANDSVDSMRRQLVGSGDRSEKIRTYNFPQGRVTDHRIGLTVHCLADILSGDKLNIVIDALHQADQLARLEKG
ncbi:MAG: peptide chain release factor 1 [Candidatus Marinamargulisbacteria bacterium]|nr:peptide chain release factor 1 [bacterium]MDG2264674.1 peptide chain release factor 1 [Candidatus Marinamargulisbacteria bacterium]|tara:strand:- start:16734 stop:17801 length:1068 start_codon:yes stop_codon:yes gene_type:complete